MDSYTEMGEIGLSEEFVRDGHRADDFECEACPPDYPRGCTCGGLIHARTMRRNEIETSGSEATYCCDECGAEYEEDVASNADDDLMFD